MRQTEVELKNKGFATGLKAVKYIELAELERDEIAGGETIFEYELDGFKYVTVQVGGCGGAVYHLKFIGGKSHVK